jgi:hypothetical protein
MLFEGEAEAFLAREGVTYLAVDSAGVLHKSAAPA